MTDLSCHTKDQNQVYLFCTGINRVFFYLIISILLTAPAMYAARIPAATSTFPVQYQGRIMPFKSFAREQILAVTGKLKWKGKDPSETVLGWMADPNHASTMQLFSVGYDQFRKEVGLDPKRRHFSLEELLAIDHIRHLAFESSKIKDNDGKPTRIQSEAEKLFIKMQSLYALLDMQRPGFVADPDDPHGAWRSLSDTLNMDNEIGSGVVASVIGTLSAYRDRDMPHVAEFASQLNRLSMLNWNPGEQELKRFNLEVLYDRLRPIYIGRVLYMIAVLLLLGSLVGWGSKLVPASAVLVWAGLAAQTGGLVLRALIGGRAPWSNFYESLVTLTGAMVLIGLLFTKGKLRGIVLGGTAFAGFFALMIADRAGLSPGVDTLVPALQSYWLTIHVIVILSGYAAAALAMVLGHAALGIEAFKPNDRPLFIASTNAVYRAVQMAMLLLFAGTVLGGVWAHEAWGRYWGWDPKETWALISWFGYVAVAHARFAGWLKPRGLAMAAIGAFPLILMTYYGVNYLLSGLHSYAGGASAQIPPLLIGFLAFEAAVLVVSGMGWHTRLAGGHRTVPSGKT